MRSFGSIIQKTTQFREPPIPGARLARAHPPAVYRLDEAVRELFHQACMTGDLHAAADLLTVVAKWHVRRTYDSEDDKRAGDIHLKRMHGELHRRHITRGTPAEAAELAPVPVADEPA